MNTLELDYSRANLHYVVGFVLLVLLGFGYIAWTASLDEERAAAAEAYEKCVRANYNMHPTAYYDKNGAWPECDATAYLSN